MSRVLALGPETMMCFIGPAPKESPLRWGRLEPQPDLCGSLPCEDLKTTVIRCLPGSPPGMGVHVLILTEVSLRGFTARVRVFGDQSQERKQFLSFFPFFLHFLSGLEECE